MGPGFIAGRRMGCMGRRGSQGGAEITKIHGVTAKFTSMNLLRNFPISPISQ
jgi:hypothetical protein